MKHTQSYKYPDRYAENIYLFTVQNIGILQENTDILFLYNCKVSSLSCKDAIFCTRFFGRKHLTKVLKVPKC